jgi:hypothetical protein
MMAGVRSAAASVVRERLVRPLLPQSVASNLNRNDRTGALFRAWGHVVANQIEGAYYEFGVYRGDAFRASVAAHRVCRQWVQDQLASDEAWRRRTWDAYANITHHFYAFDTFEGIPENAEGERTFAAGNFSCSLGEFARRNREAGILEGPGVRYVAGAFSEVAQRRAGELAGLQPAAIVNLDCDLYASARDALALVAPKLQQGTVLLADDWNTFRARRDQGERRALAEFLDRHREVAVEPWFTYEFAGQAFLIHREAG